MSRRSTVGLVAAGFTLTALVYGLARFAYGLLLPQIRAELSLSTLAAGWIGSAAFSAYCFSILVAFLAVPRWGPRVVAALAGLCATAGLVLAGLADSALSLGAAIALTGISTGLASPPLAAAVSRQVFDAGRPLANGAINAGTAAGIILSGVTALAFASAWRELYFGFAGIGAAVTLWLWRAIPAEADEDLSPSGLRLRRHGLVPLGIAALSMGGASTAIWTFGADILREELGFVKDRIALAWIVLGVAGLAGLVTGAATDRLGLGHVHRLSLALMAVAVICLAAGSAYDVLPYLAMGLFGAGYIISSGTILLWGITLFPDRADLGLGLPFLMIAAGQTAGATAFGALLDIAGAPLALSAAALLMAGAALPAPASHGVVTATADPTCGS